MKSISQRAILAASSAAMIVFSSARAEPVDYPVGDIRSIHVKGDLIVSATPGDTASAAAEFTVSSDQSATEVTYYKFNGMLSLERDRYAKNSGKPIRIAIVYTPALEEIYGARGAKIEVGGLKAGSIELQANDSGTNVTVDGECDNVRINAAAKAIADASRLLCDRAFASVSNDASISVYATTSIEARASSGGSIRIFGDPQDVSKDAEVMGPTSPGTITLEK